MLWLPTAAEIVPEVSDRAPGIPVEQSRAAAGGVVHDKERDHNVEQQQVQGPQVQVGRPA